MLHLQQILVDQEVELVVVEETYQEVRVTHHLLAQLKGLMEEAQHLQDQQEITLEVAVVEQQ